MITNNYRKWVLFALVLVLCLMMSIVHAYTLVGQWTAMDKNTHQPQSIITIWANHGLLYGKHNKLFPTNEKNSLGNNDLCSKCPGALHNKPIQGLIFLSGLKRVGPYKWGGGKILDPSSGHIYHCQIVVRDHGRRLSVRSYVGLPLFGTTQIWERIRN